TVSSTRRETIIYEKSGPVVLLTMNRPDRLNGMTNRMLVETRDALAAAAEDRELRVLVLSAAVNGACAGAGLGWALACDFRFAAESARFNVAFLDVGVAGDMGGPWSLSRIVGSARARELYFLPGKFDAAEALRIGLVTRVFPDDRFQEEVDAIVNRLTDCAPIALRTLKA